MAFDQSEFIWMNGQIIPWNEANVHVSTHALHYGSGVFEGMRCYETVEGSAVFRMDAHLERLFGSAAVYGIDIPHSREEIEEAVCDVIRRNGFKSCYVRPICFFGSDTLGVHPRNCPVNVAILTWPWGAYLGDDQQETGVRVTVSSWQKFGLQMMPATAKASGQYLNSMLSVREAVNRGFDEGLLLNADGTIAEGSGENLFLVRNRNVFTNDEKSSILLGITREVVIQIARDLGYEVEIGAMRLDDLLSADEAFFTGTATEVAPIREVDGKQIGSGKRGPVTEEIQRVFFAATSGREAKYRGWLRFVHDQPARAGAA